MQLGTAIKPISWIKENAAQMVRDIEETGKPIIITQNGLAKAVVMGIQQFDELQESLSLLRLLAMGEEDIKAGRVRPADDVFAELQKEIDYSRLPDAKRDKTK